MKSMNFAAVCACIVALPPISHSQGLQCPDITKTLREHSISTSSSSYLNSVFDEHCEQNGTAKSSSGALGIDTVVKTIPLKFTGSFSTNREAIQNFCKTYASTTSQESRTYSYLERISSKALETVSECLRLQSLGVTITHDIQNLEKMNFFLKAAVDRHIELSGVDVTPNVACKGQISGTLASLSPKTYIDIDKSQSFVCTREPTTDSTSGVRAYSEAVITVQTNLGNYSVLWPRDEALPENIASNISNRLNVFQSRFADTNARMGAALDSIQFTKVCAARGDNNGKPWDLPLSCPSGWIRTDLLINNWWNGGPHGQGDTCRVCYRVNVSAPDTP